MRRSKPLPKDSFFNDVGRSREALAYDDVTLLPGYSVCEPAAVDLSTLFSRDVDLKIPISGAAMPNVSGRKMGIGLAKLGAIAVIPRDGSPKEQERIVNRVKKNVNLNGPIEEPISVVEDQTVQSVLDMKEEEDFSFDTFPVIDAQDRLVGILAAHDIEFCPDSNLPVRDVMTKGRRLVTAPSDTSPEEAFRRMMDHKVKMLPLVHRRKLTGMYLHSDLRDSRSSGRSMYNVDDHGHLRVAAAIGVGEEALERAKLLVGRRVDVIVIDTAHADTIAVRDTLGRLKELYPKLNVVVGNISNPEAAKRLVEWGADGVKVGQGPGSICSTRIVAGTGRPQLTAVYSCALAIRGSGIPVCADGGIRFSGHITIALGAGAHCVMIGNRLAGTDEAPGEVIFTRNGSFKTYEGMGSIESMMRSKAAQERYRAGSSKPSKLVAEGVKGRVRYTGALVNVIDQLTGGLRSGMGGVGAANIAELHRKADFDRQSDAAIRESHPHDLIDIDDAPNYWREQR